jgi:hypothetical protein
MNKIIMPLVFILCTITLTTAGCATYTTHFDYDPDVRFAELKNYDWLSPTIRGQTISELTVKRIKASTERQLIEKGYRMDTVNPDFLIAIHGGREKKVDLIDWGYTYRGYKHYHYGYYNRSHRIDIYEYQEGTLILDFVDAESRELIWRGSVTRVIDPNATPEKRERVINEAVAKILEKFPPPTK